MTKMANERSLADKIKQKSATIAITGLGYVGLTTAALFAETGFYVIGSDIKMEVVNSVSSGKSYIKEPGINELVRKNVEKGRLRATHDVLEAAQEADIDIVCVQTPLNDKNEPDQSFVEKACESIAGGVAKGKMVVIESTVSPGTTRNTIARIFEKGTQLRCGTDFWLAYCPERITVGKALQDFVNNTRIVGGYDDKSAKIAANLFSTVTKGRILITDCSSAEVAKLTENAFRYVNIAFANELALLCERLGVDVVEAIKLANTHPRVNVHNPGPGVGGPCLPKDTYLLLHSIKENGSWSKVIEASGKTNEYMPTHIVSLLSKALNDIGKNIKRSKVVVLGTAYRGGVDDARNSPAKKVVTRLIDLGGTVAVYDPHCQESFGARRIQNIVDGAKNADALVVATDHQEFKKLDLEAIKSVMNAKPVIIDSRRIINAEDAAKVGFKYVGIGLSKTRNHQ